MTSEQSKSLQTALQGAKIAILGYGREGHSIHRYLLSQAPDAEISIVDAKPHDPIPGASPTTKQFSGDGYLQGLTDSDIIFRSPGVPLHVKELTQCAAAGARITTLMNVFMAHARECVVGITGTKGKSTTASLLAAMLAQKYNDVRLVGNIGEPALDFLHGSTPETKFVSELSSFQLEDLECSPHIAVVLNIVPEHLDHHLNYDSYVRAKQRILQFQQSDDIAVVSPYSSHIAASQYIGAARRVYYSSTASHPAQVMLVDDWIVDASNTSVTPILPLGEIPLIGPGNIENVLAATATALSMEVPAESIRTAVASFTPLAHRLEPVGEFQGIRFYNDSLATIPQATIQALQGLGDQVETLIAGGFDRGVDFEPLGKELALRLTKLKNIILFPTTGEKIWRHVIAIAGTEIPPPHFVTSMEEAVRLAYHLTSRGKVCLLSPASSSFNMFRDYLDRGECFKRCVHEFGVL